MLLKRLVAAGVAATAITAMAGAGVATASTSGPQSLTIINTGPPGTPAPAVLAGVVRGAGTSVNSEDAGSITLPGGTIFATHPITTDNTTFDPVACLLKVDERGPYTFTSGTGAYAGISGSGTYRTSGVVVFAHTAQGCGAPVSTLVIVQGRGTTTLP
jgi:hypothetical protein